ncbi:MAG: class I SAM-dependent methyltransferase [Polyangiaceae bacterium]
MRTRDDWDERYREPRPPWDVGVPDEHLVELVTKGRIGVGRALEIGCGTGTNARWLAEQGFDVVALDLAPLAIDKARAAGAPKAGSVALHCLDFLNEEVPGGPFDFVFDRGCFHVFDHDRERGEFAARVAELLRPDGLWLSLIGSTEGAPRDVGPPRRSARDIMHAIEPELAIIELRASRFGVNAPESPHAWMCLCTRRTMPAQPSTLR